MRPKYETKEMVAASNALADRFAAKFGGTVERQPEFSTVNYMVMKDHKPVAWLETKMRAYSFAKLRGFGGFYMEQERWSVLRALSVETNLKVILVAQDGNGEIRYRSYKAETFDGHKVTLGGRTDRSDPKDVVPQILINPDDLHLFEDEETIRENLSKRPDARVSGQQLPLI